MKKQYNMQKAKLRISQMHPSRQKQILECLANSLFALSAEEIANATGIPLGTVKSFLTKQKNLEVELKHIKKNKAFYYYLTGETFATEHSNGKESRKQKEKRVHGMMGKLWGAS